MPRSCRVLSCSFRNVLRGRISTGWLDFGFRIRQAEMLLEKYTQLLGVAAAEQNAWETVLQASVVHSDLSQECVIDDRHTEVDIHLVTGAAGVLLPDCNRARRRFAFPPTNGDCEPPPGFVLRGVESGILWLKTLKKMVRRARPAAARCSGRVDWTVFEIAGCGFGSGLFLATTVSSDLDSLRKRGPPGSYPRAPFHAGEAIAGPHVATVMG